MWLRNKKTGGVFDAIVRERRKRDGSYSLIVCELKEHRTLCEYDSLTKLCEEWESYEPTEPLIKDEKIRKAVRAWAEACEINSALVYHSFFDTFLTLKSGVKIISFQVETPKELEFDEEYTIIELCGEEEE